MLKKNKGYMIVSSLVILIPMIVGLLLWEKLPETMATHFDTNGEANGWSSKPFAVFGIPLLLIALQWIGLLATSADPKRRNIHPKVLTLMLYTVPAVALVTLGLIYATALGTQINTTQFLYPFLSLVFILVGNYLPKCRQSYTMGIKLPWTLANEENWNKTHRMAGPLWMLCGLATLPCFFLPREFAITLLFAALFTAVLVPTIYSFLLAKKKGQI